MESMYEDVPRFIVGGAASSYLGDQFDFLQEGADFVGVTLTYSRHRLTFRSALLDMQKNKAVSLILA